MSQNLKIKGVNYNGVDSVKIPTQAGGTADFIIPQGTKNITVNGTHDVKNVASAVVNVPTLDTSDANAGVYDIYNGKTAYVNGQKITGAYKYQGHSSDSQWSANSAGCSATELVIPVPFEPKGCCVDLNSGTYTSNTVVSADFRLGGVATYHTYRGTNGMYRNQYTSNIQNYISYDANTKKLTIKSPSSSYKWSSNNYRVLIFK